jgi:hypothetical protein
MLGQCWLTRIPGVEPVETKPGYHERGSYNQFDIEVWGIVRKDNFVLHYDALEVSPGLPRAVPPPPPQGQQHAPPPQHPSG